MTKTKLSGRVDMLHVSIDKMRQVNGERVIRQRKRQEKRLLNKSKFAHVQPLSPLGEIVKRSEKRLDKIIGLYGKKQKVSDQIQRGFDIAEKWKDENER